VEQFRRVFPENMDTEQVERFAVEQQLQAFGVTRGLRRAISVAPTS